jgi:hypothetical protein
MCRKCVEMGEAGLGTLGLPARENTGTHFTVVSTRRTLHISSVGEGSIRSLSKQHQQKFFPEVGE